LEGHSLLSDIPEKRIILSLEGFQESGTIVGEGTLFRIDHPGPPRYGIKTVGLIDCDRWNLLNISDGKIEERTIANHTGECLDEDRPTPDQLRTVLRERFEKAKIQVGF
jgi:hypothetical protein